MSSDAIEMLGVVAKVLEKLPQQVVFTGGATIPLYLDAYAASEMRPTDDVDCVVEILSQADYYRLAKKLRELGLSEDSSKGAPMCRWICNGVKLDMMPVDPVILGFGNRWYERGVATAIGHILPNGCEIQIFSVPYLLGAKIEAFKNRGKNQYYFSKDFEDIIMVLNGCPNLLTAIQHAEKQVKNFVVEWVRLERKNLDNLAPAFLSGEESLSGRGAMLLEVIDRLAGL
jgi:predicted nucleotidyltransferase